MDCLVSSENALSVAEDTNTDIPDLEELIVTLNLWHMKSFPPHLLPYHSHLSSLELSVDIRWPKWVQRIYKKVCQKTPLGEKIGPSGSGISLELWRPGFSSCFYHNFLCDFEQAT